MKPMFMRDIPKWYYFTAGAFAVLIVGAFFPSYLVREHHPPTENAKYIRRIFDEHTVGQSVRYADYALDAIEVVARAETQQMSTVVATDEQGRELGRTEVALTPHQDTWFRIAFREPLPTGEHTITFTVDPQRPRAEAVLLRFQPLSHGYEEGNMIVDGEASYGDLGFTLIERAPLWKAVIVYELISDWSIRRTLTALGVGVLAVVIVLGATRIKLTRWPNANVWIPLLLLFVVAIVVRVPYINNIEGVHGGDAFNYLSKTNALLLGVDPFAADPRKGPFYSLLLLPGFLTADPLLWSRWVGVVAAAATASLLPLVGRRAGLTWPYAVMAGLLLAINIEFMWEAPSGLALTVFTLLIVTAAYAYLRVANSLRWLWALAVCAGLIMLTRFEGAVVGAVLLPAAWLRYRIPFKRIVPPTILAGALMAIPYVSVFWSGVSGVRTASDIAGDEGLFLVRSIWDIQLFHNIDRSYEFFTNLWLLKGGNINVSEWIGIGLLVGAGTLLLKYWLPQVARYVVPTVGLLLLPAFVLLLLTDNEIYRETIVKAVYVLAGIGFIAWLKRQPINAAAILLAVMAHVAVIIWVVPKGRYFLPAIPFLCLAIVYGVYALMPGKGRVPHVLSLLLLGAASAFFYFDGIKTLEGRTEEYNSKGSDTYVMLEALRQLRREQVQVGAHPTGDVPTSLYIPPDRLHMFKYNEEVGGDHARQELEWIRGSTVERLLERDREPQWLSVQEYPELFEQQIYDSRHGTSKVFVYTIKRDKLEEFQAGL